VPERGSFRMGPRAFRGLNVTRPSRRAVSSPSFQAAKAWAASWEVIAMRIGMTHVDAG
jgi:hypothetical protein